MNSLIESLNVWGGRFVDVALPIFWQSSALIALVFGIDLLLRRKIRPAVRYALWLVVIVKLVLPPSLALPTAAAWWLRTHNSPPPETRTQILTVSVEPSLPNFSPVLLPAPQHVAPLPPPKPSLSAWAMLASAVVSVLLMAWAAFRWWKISQCVRKTTAPSTAIFELFEETRRQAGVRKKSAIRLTAETMSPAVCGLWRPVVLLPQSLIERLTPEQLRAVLLHELVHVRRGDVWINCAQTLLQIIYWWHPLVWFANARIRRVREEAVDDAVMFALNDEAEIYAPTLLEVAKLAFNRPLAGLGIIGILESRAALKHRIERLLNFKTPGRAGLSAVWILGLAAFTAVAVPMGEAPEKDLAQSSDGVGVVRSIRPSTSADTVVNAPTSTNSSNQIGGTWQGGPTFNPLNSNAIHTNPARQEIYQKLQRITLEQISFTNMPLNEVVRTLNEQALQQDPDHEGVHILLRKGAARPGAKEMDPSQVKINMDQLKDMRLLHVLEAITKSSDWPIKYSILDDGVEFSFLGPQTPELRSRTFMVDSNALYSKLGQIGLSSTNSHGMVDDFFKAAGISLDPPKSFYFSAAENKLTVRSTVEDLDLIARLLPRKNESVKDTETANSVQDATNSSFERSLQAKISYLTNQVTDVFDYGLDHGQMSQSRKVFAQKVIQELLSIDPDNQFGLYYSNLMRQAQAGKVDASSGMNSPDQTGETPETAASIQDAKLLFERGKLDEAWAMLQKVLTVDPDNQTALYYSGLIKQAQAPKAADGTQGSTPILQQNQSPLFIRTFKLDMNTFSQNLGLKSGRSASDSDFHDALSNAIQSMGVDMKPPKSFFYNSRVGTLTVRATTNDLDSIESVIESLNITPPEVNIKARFVEVDAANGGIDAIIKNSLTNSPSKTNAWTGILTRDQFTRVLQALEKGKGAKLLNEGEVITLSGRQASFQIVDIKTLVTGFNTIVTNNSTSYNYKMDSQPFGSTLDVLPNVDASGDTISMTVTPMITEFLGYEDPKNLQKYDENLKHAQLPLPKSRVRKTTTAATVRDGQTMIIGNLNDQWVITGPDGYVSRPYTDKTDKKKKQLLVFITATIIDSSGKPVHPRDYYDDPILQ